MNIRTLLQAKVIHWKYFVMAGLILLCNVSCTTFSRKWDQAGAVAPQNEHPFGRWKGSWTSDVNGHTGELRCILTQQEGEGVEADFHARFWKFFSWRYTLPLEIADGEEGFQLQGSSNLGWLFGGQYTCEGLINGMTFRADYTNRYDHGVMVMEKWD